MENEEKKCKCCCCHCDACKTFLIALLTSLLVVIVYHVGTCFFRTRCAKAAACRAVPAQMAVPQFPVPPCPQPEGCPMMHRNPQMSPEGCLMMRHDAQKGKDRKDRNPQPEKQCPQSVGQKDPAPVQ